MLSRDLHLPAPDEDTALWCTVSYTDGALTREEILRTSGASDAYHDFQRRISRDNGRTWSALQPIEDATRQLPGGGIVTYPCGHDFDPHLGIAYEKKMRRIWPGLEIYTFEWGSHRHPCNDHVFIDENGQGEKLLRYEDGPDYDPENPFDPEFCATNRAYLGQGVAFSPDGVACFPMCCITGQGPDSHNTGGLVLMRRDPSTGEWSPSNRQYLSPEQSSFGVREPDVAVLQDGTLLVVLRGKNTDVTPGHKWFSVSSDGGRTLSPVGEFRYHDGSQFYSPSSIHKFVRSSKNGKLYWLANITATAPDGMSPRYPLYIAEIDEAKIAVRKDSLVTVDDRGKDEPEALQLSNFSVIDNRETQDIEIYLTRIGEHPEHFWQGAVYRYVFTPPA